MSTETQDRINMLLEMYLSENQVDEHVIAKFRAWFADEGHIEEKYKALEMFFDANVVFDQAPADSVMRSYTEICGRLGLPPHAKYFGSGEPIFTDKKPSFFKRVAFLRVAGVAASIAIVFGAVFFVFNKQIPQENIANITEEKLLPPVINPSGTILETKQVNNQVNQVCLENEKMNVSLPDNSYVWINENSQIEYDDDFNNSRIVALNGEAFFKVAKKDGKEFVVKTDDIMAVVKGTTFNVQSYPNSSVIIISLYEGALEVESYGQKYYLSAGQELEYNKVNSEVTIEPIYGYMPEWLDKVVGFEETKVEDILNQLQRVYNIPIIVTDKSLTDEVITVYFEQGILLNNLMYILSQMSNKFSYRYDTENNSVYIISK